MGWCKLRPNRSGLYDYATNPLVKQAALTNRIYLPEDSLKLVGKPNFLPGGGYAYCNWKMPRIDFGCHCGLVRGPPARSWLRPIMCPLDGFISVHWGFSHVSLIGLVLFLLIFG